MNIPRCLGKAFFVSLLASALSSCGQSPANGTSIESSLSSVSTSEASLSIEERTSSEEEIPSSEEIVVSSNEPVSSEESLPSSEEPLYYVVTFLNDDETFLYEDEVMAGETAIYEGDTPTKVEDDGFIYTFAGWDKDLTDVHESFSTKALYDKEADEGWTPIIWF